MKKILFLSVFLCEILLNSCGTVPISGRKQFDLIPDSEINSMSLTQYQDFISKNQVIAGTADAAMVQRVGRRLAGAVEQYLRDHGNQAEISNFKWEYNLVNSKEVNAWCMPGGKIVVYSGILPICQGEDGLAVVLGHEISHAVAKHGGERMSTALVTQLGGQALSVALSSKPDQTRNIFLDAYGIGSNLGVLLPFSREQESEADKLGLVFMAMAGYDPNNAISFWQRMMSASNGGAPPEILSDHPSDERRIADLKAFLPTALKSYKKQ
jgi:predicted Zn-dependent protease